MTTSATTFWETSTYSRATSLQLAVNNQHGTFADLNASRKLTERLYASLDLNKSSYNLPNAEPEHIHHQQPA